MRRYWVVSLAVLTVFALFWALTPPALAQAPEAKVTITGLIDNLVNYNKNQGMFASDRLRGGFTQTSDREFYSRTRGRFDIIGELAKAKAVLGLEIDCVYGSTGATSTNSNLGKQVAPGFRPDGSGCVFGADNDVTSAIEIKWMYVEAPATGPGSLLPFIPWAGTLTLGGQGYFLDLKPSILADSDFGGVTYRVAVNPTLQASLTYAQIEESSAGRLAGPSIGTNFGFGRGDDFGIIAKIDATPVKGLRVSPIYALQELQGTTHVLVRRGTGGYGVGAPNFAPDSTAGLVNFGSATTNIFRPAVTPCVNLTAPRHRQCRRTIEYRHTLGADARWDRGPFYINPTAFYQFGSRQRFESATDPGADPTALRRRTADIDAWIVDVQTGYRFGPLLLEARALYTTGNEAKDNLNSSINYYQPFQTGNSYWIGWGEAHTIGNIDYLTSFAGFSNSFSETGNIGYDRYGRAQISIKGTYALTPALSVYGIVTPMWTAEAVDTKQVITASGLALPVGVSSGVVVTRPCDRACGDLTGKRHYIGTDLTTGFTWRFAPGLSFDWVYGLLITGEALDATVDTAVHAGADAASGVFQKFPSKNTYVTTARIRYSF